MEAVGFFPRLGAVLIDVVVVVVIFAVLSVVGLGGFQSAMQGASFIGSLIALAYVSMEVFKAATPGKMVLGLKIMNADGSPASQEVLIKRFVVKQASGLLSFLTALTGLTLFSTLGAVAGLVIFVGCFLTFTESKQALHDRAAKTKVFKA